MVLDTNVYVGWLRSGSHEAFVYGTGLDRHLSVVVLMELHLGAQRTAARRGLAQLVRPYERRARLVVPSVRVFERAARVLARLKLAGRDVRRASLVHDVLIALSARAIGAAVVTADAGDFEAIRRVDGFDLVIVPEAA